MSIRGIYTAVQNNGLYKKMLASAATLALVSTTTKDGVNCYYYVTQSLHNKKIPEEKRKFVAGLDLSNGILNVVVQFAMGSLMNKYSPKLFNKWFGKHFTKEAAIKKLKEIRTAQPTEKYTLEQIEKTLKTNKGLCKSGFEVIAVLLVTQVFVKRVIVPLLATPMAGVFKKQLEKREKQVAEKKQLQQTNTAPAEVKKEDKTDEKEETTKTQNTSAKTETSVAKVTTSSNLFDNLVKKPVKFEK